MNVWTKHLYTLWAFGVIIPFDVETVPSLASGCPVVFANFLVFCCKEMFQDCLARVLTQTWDPPFLQRAPVLCAESRIVRPPCGR